ncbi:hypothetical protein BU24DRAFT_8248 [Aaosphaeria arxii CBS 175.79]|uniref:Uncharacterized protein n=1 Tax=Aaosphaeria arxii CBS 175.79 TaxID=1450172 RepID=A0A6A5Y5D9_9PLEO|nr:uncharacterized protein BU24DRAFT_8248 [Aaosphaeria arxii CBS 175.79]KAF2020775.1 hypothetical protein BU24DRAFT_8248 [Aaosphaeria arxii CBS 175.79]
MTPLAYEEDLEVLQGRIYYNMVSNIVHRPKKVGDNLSPQPASSETVKLPVLPSNRFPTDAPLKRSTPSKAEDRKAKKAKVPEKVQLQGEISGLLEELDLLKCKLTNKDGDTDHEAMGYNFYGRRKLCAIIEENWDADLTTFFRNDARGIDIHPRIPPTKEHDLSAFTKRRLAREGESVTEFLERMNDAPKNPLDFGFDILSHLAVVSEFTEGLGDGMRQLLFEAVQTRKAQYRARNTGEMLILDVKKVINDLVQEAEQSNEKLSNSDDGWTSVCSCEE